jgi:hypothetical protein
MDMSWLITDITMFTMNLQAAQFALLILQLLGSLQDGFGLGIEGWRFGP